MSSVIDIGYIKTTIGSTLAQLWEDFLEHLPFLAAALIVLLATWIFAAVFRRFSNRLLSPWKLRRSLKNLITRFLMIGIWSIGFLVCALIIFPGLTPAKAIGGLGLVSVAIGFAFKDIFENFFAGVLILWRFPFEPGDFIECEGLMGRVEETTVRMTTLRRPTGELIVVPNSMLFKSSVNVLTARARRRTSIDVGIAYGEDVDKAVEVIRRATSECPTVSAAPEVEVFPKGFGASSIDIEVAWWSDPTPLGVRRSRGEVVASIKRNLDEAGIEIPFPYRTLVFKEPAQTAGEESRLPAD